MFHIVYKYIKGYKKNTVLCILGIAFSVTLMFSVIQMGNRLLFQFRQMLNSVAGDDFQVVDISFEQMDQIYSYIQSNAVEFSSMKRTIYGTSRFDDNLATIQIAGVEGQWQDLLNVSLLAGEPPAESNEICVEQKYCDYLKKDMEEMVGQDITLVVGDDEGNEFEITYRVSGIISNAPTSYPIYYMYTSYDGAIAQMNAYHFKHDQQYDSVAVLLDKNSNDTEKIMDLVVQIMDKYGEGEKFYANHIKFNEYRLEIFNNEGAYRGVRMTFYGIAVFIACCLVLFVYHTISMGMAEKIRQYGTMRCIGLDHIQLIKLMGMEMSLYALLGLILGILSGNVLNELVADRIIQYLLDLDTGMYINSIGVYVATILLTLVSVVLAFLSTYLKIRKMQPIEMLNFVEDKKMKIKIREKETNLMQEMASRNLKRNPSTSRVLLITLTMCGTIIMVLFNVISSIDIKRGRAKEKFADYEVYSDVISGQYISNAQITGLMKSEGIADVYCQKIDNEFMCTPNTGNSKYGTSLVIYSDNLYEKFLEINHIKGYDVKTEDVAIVFSFNDDQYHCDTVKLVCTDELVEMNPDVQKNSTVTVNEIIYEGYSLLGGSVISEGDRAYLIINEKLAKKIYGSIDQYTDILIACEGDRNMDVIRQVLSESNFTYIDLKDTLEADKAQILGMGYMCIYILCAVVILSILIMSNIIKSNVTKRVKELGMLRSIGAEENMVRKLLCAEIMNLSVRAVLLSCMISLPVSLYFSEILNDRISVKLLGYIVGSLVVLGGSYLFTYASVKRNLSGRISEMLRYD